MKEQIMEVLWGDTSAEAFTLTVTEERRGRMVQKDGGENRTVPLTGVLLDDALDEISSLLGTHPEAEPCDAPLLSEVHLKDGTVRYLPHDALGTAMDTAWHNGALERAIAEGPQLMGAVAYNPPPGTVQNFGMMGMMGMMQPEPPKTPESVRIDSETWNCGCGAAGLHSKFCPTCGAPAPVAE